MNGFLRTKRRARLSPREERERINKAHEFVAAMAPDKEKADQYRSSFVRELPPKRQPRMDGVNIDAVHRSENKILEKHVLAAVLMALRHDPRVALVDRRQSGVFQEGERYIRVGSRGTLDISGMLVGGKYFEIECKRPGGKPDERQAERIATIKSNGGIAGYAWSAESALAILP